MLGMLLDAVWFRHRRFHCWLYGHTWTSYTDPTYCKWCAQRGWPR